MSTHPTIAAFPTVNGELAVGGVPLRRLAERVGSTPFFAYDRALIDQRVEQLRIAEVFGYITVCGFVQGNGKNHR